jgi:hypothetical protein
MSRDSLRIAVVALDDPWERPHGGTLRTRAIVDACRDLGHETHVVYPGVPPDAAVAPAGVHLHPVASRPLGERQVPGLVSRVKRAVLPLPTLRGGYVAALAQTLREVGPVDVLSVSQLRATQYLQHAGGTPKLWLDQSDLWSGMLQPEIERRSGITRVGALAQQRHIARAERQAFASAGAVTAAGHADAETIQRMGGRTARWLPTPIATPTSVPPLPSRPTVGLLGNFAFWPNRDAYDLLREAWLPRLREAGVACIVAGFESEHLPPAPGIELIGPVAAASDFYAQVSATVAPIRLGGGIKVKIAESLVYGRPVLATAKALEGFDPPIRKALPVVALDGAGIQADIIGNPPAAATAAHARDVFSDDTFRASVAATIEELRA